jgi:hypothetical protein
VRQGTCPRFASPGRGRGDRSSCFSFWYRSRLRYLHASILTGSPGGQYRTLATRLADRAKREHGTHASGDAINAVLAATGYNFRRLLAWLRFLLLTILIALGLAAQLKST